MQAEDGVALLTPAARLAVRFGRNAHGVCQARRTPGAG
jgi:hypothetical protein